MTTTVDSLSSEIKKKIRYMSIDVFRGLAIAPMVFVNTLSEFNTTPAWSKHAIDFGLTYVDLVAPFFIFAIALTYKMSFERSLEKDRSVKTYVKFIRRYAALLGFGTLGSLYITPYGINFGWGVLQAIGLAAILTVFFIKIPKSYRFIIGFILLEVYQFLIGITLNIDGTLITISDLGFNDGHGGFIGGFGYGFMMIFSTAIVDDFQEIDKLEILIIGIIFIVLGPSLHFIWVSCGFPAYGGLSKLRVTHSYILLTIGLAAITFWAMWYIYDFHRLTKNKSYFLQPQGKNALFLYIIQPIFLGLSILYLNRDAHVALVFVSGFINIAAI
ncbi:MAG: DUF1624 domain-containing protein [Candidatus Heimdallarchaeota archaeon]